MSAHVLLNLLNVLGKRNKLLEKPRILSLFRNEFNKSNNTRVRMLDSIYITLNLISAVNIIMLSFTQRCYGRPEKWFYRFYSMALFHSQTRRHYMIKEFCIVWLLQFLNS